MRDGKEGKNQGGMIARQTEKNRKEGKGQSVVTRCAWCNSIRNDIGGWEAAEDAGDSGEECPITHTMCLECLKKADPELHKVVSEILDEDQSAQGG